MARGFTSTAHRVGNNTTATNPLTAEGSFFLRIKPNWSAGDSAHHQFLEYGSFNSGSDYKLFSFQKFTDNNVYIGWEENGSDQRIVVADTGLFTSGTWANHLLTWSDGANEERYYVNNVEAANRTSALTPWSTASVYEALGNLIDQVSRGSGLNADAALAEFGRWNRVLAASERAVLQVSGTPLTVLRGLIEYRAIGRMSPEGDVMGQGVALTVSGASATDHPRVFYPSTPQVGRTQTVVVALDEARSGVAHSGNARSGDFTPSFAIAIDGTERTRKVWSADSQIVDLQGGDPNTMSARARGFDITEGEEIKVYNGGIDVGVPYFCGHILEVSPGSSRKRDRVVYDFVATDYTWLLDQQSKVTGYYRSIGVNVLVRKLIADFAPSGFTAGYLPSSLGDITEMQFTNETFSDAMTRIADRVDGGALWSCDYNRTISMWPLDEEDPHAMGTTLTVVDGDSHRGPQYRIDLKQIRTRVICDGGGSATTSLTSAGGTSIAVDECGWYRSTGGTFRAAQTIGTYTGKTVDTGPGSITGVSITSGTRDISQGEQIVVRAQADDSAAQTALAALIGGSGIAVHVVSDGRLSLDECEKRATAELAYYSAQLREFSYAVDDEVNTVSGRNVAVNVTRPATVNTTLRAQRVIIRKRSKVEGSTIGLERIVTVAPVRVDLANVLERLE